MIKLAEYVLSVVEKAGTRDVFLVPGGAAMHLNDALGQSKLNYVATFHEHAAAVAAEAYAKQANGLGVAMVTAGPGSTNAITGVGSAWVNSAPLLVLSGQVKSTDVKQGPIRQLGLQEIDIISIVAPITKYAVTVMDPGTIRFHMEKAIHLATTGRPGPVWIAIPMDIQAAMIDPASQPGYTPEPTRSDGALAKQIDQLIELLDKAERPVLLAGGGIRFAGAERRFRELVELLGIPVQTTWVGVDLLPDNHPLYAGRPGSFASRGANFAVQNSDFMLALGARLDFATTGYSRTRFARAAKRVAVDVDPAEIDKMRDVLDLGIVAGADAVIDELLRRRSTLGRRDRSSWLKRVQAWKERYPVVTPDLRGKHDSTSTYVLVEKLSQLLNNDDVVVEGSSGIHSEIFFLTYEVKENQRVHADGSYGSMGYGVPAVIGICVAAGRRRTILVDGDGSFQPNIQELQTIVREKLPVKMIIVNNDGYSSIRSSQQRYFQRLVAADASSGLSIPDFGRVAAAYGIRYVKIGAEHELDEKMRQALAGPDPVICEVVVPPEEDRVPRLSTVQKADGRLVSRPLEDMFPFLEREEFLANMLIDPLPED